MRTCRIAQSDDEVTRWGYVERIGWRGTRIRMLPNKTAVVPNSKLVQSTIINYDLPDPEVAVLVQVGVHYDSDLKKVERVANEVAKEIMSTVSGFETFIRYHTFNQSSIDFSVILRAQRFVDNYLIKHEFNKVLQKKYREEEMLFPCRSARSDSKSILRIRCDHVSQAK